MRYRYEIRGYQNQEEANEGLGTSYHNERDTLKEAKELARRIVKSAFHAETDCHIGYSQVIETKTGDCVADYYAR